MNRLPSHDTFFRYIFSSSEAAADLLQGVMPKEMSQEIDLGSLKRRSGSFVDAKLSSRAADLVFDGIMTDKKQIRIIILLEHKSAPDKNVEIQLLGYILELLREGMNTPFPRPKILPIIFYHGKTGWKKHRLRNFYSGAYARYIPLFDYFLIDLTTLQNSDIAGETLFRLVKTKLAIVAQKNIFGLTEIKHAIDSLLSIMRRSKEGEKNKTVLIKTLLYIMSKSPCSQKYLIKKVAAELPEAKEAVMTMAMKIKESGRKEGVREGMEKGLEKGIDRGRRELQKKFVGSMLHDGEPIAKISRYTGLSVKEIKEMKSIGK